MSTGESFEDDVDTVPQCTGACCDPVRLTGEDYWDISRNPGGHHNARYVLNMLIYPGPVPRTGRVEFACRYFDRETRRCVAYDRRPLMCREFPETGLCPHCGGRFATTARVPPAGEDEPTAAGSAKLAAMQSLISDEMRNSPTVHSRKRQRKRGRR